VGDRVRVLGWEQDAHPVEDHRSTRLDEPAARLARCREMIQIAARMRVLVAIEPVDGRKGIDSLARLCQDKLQEDPFSGCVFVFRSRSGAAIRLLTYDGQGYWLAQKRLSKGRFVWWPEAAGPAKGLEACEAQLLMAAGDVSRVRAAPMWRG
jgi:transposase